MQGAWVMDTRKHESQIQQKGDKLILEIKTKVMWRQEEMGMRLNKRVTTESQKTDEIRKQEALDRGL